MSVSYDPDELPPETVGVSGYVWTREQFDSDAYQWMRELDDNEYDWDASEVDIVGTNVPIRIVSLQLRNNEWHVEGAETAGPNYHRPGFTELISSEFADTFTDADSAFEAVREYIQRLS